MSSSTSDKSSKALKASTDSQKEEVPKKVSSKKTDLSRKSSKNKNSVRIAKLSKQGKTDEYLNQLSYDPQTADKTVSPNEILKDERFYQVARTITAFVAGSITDKYSKRIDLSDSEKKSRQAKRLREALIELGPTFIKLGPVSFGEKRHIVS